MTDFNYIFQKTWDRIPTSVKPTPSNAFLHYLRAFNSDSATTIQTMGGNTFPDAYEIEIREENILIQRGKLTPRPPIPFFPNIPNHQLAMAPIPTTSTSQPLALAPQASTSLNGMDEIKEMMHSMIMNIDKILQGQEKKLEDSFSIMQKVSKK